MNTLQPVMQFWADCDSIESLMTENPSVLHGLLDKRLALEAKMRESVMGVRLTFVRAAPTINDRVTPMAIMTPIAKMTSPSGVAGAYLKDTLGWHLGSPPGLGKKPFDSAEDLASRFDEVVSALDARAGTTPAEIKMRFELSGKKTRDA